ncbi:hypothetical protein HaLaN_22968 [Haematococcus lacustris]|uniref:Uncharacterized protein n=1 Tax=Haematococcus lacustris TaxID=44745 RepID=A0A699ZQI2_HAELA|nr:hypothetical protein HaLaN_22968 [Haematococcus lacustris]
MAGVGEAFTWHAASSRTVFQKEAVEHHPGSIQGQQQQQEVGEEGVLTQSSRASRLLPPLRQADAEGHAGGARQLAPPGLLGVHRRCASCLSQPAT